MSSDTSSHLDAPSVSSPTSPTTYPQIIFFGDSITQFAELALLPPLRDAYSRKADLINRGFSGYTAPMALDILPRFFPRPSQANVRLMAIFFGANDACLPGFSQHVPLRTYVESLKGIVRHEGVRAQGTKLLLIVPSPVNEWLLMTSDPDDPTSPALRTAANTMRYADACRGLGTQLGVPIVDLWTLFMRAAGWDGGKELPGSKACPKNEVLDRLLPDGLHLSPEAYSLMRDELMKVIEDKYPEETPDRLPSVFMTWDQALRVAY